MDNLGPDGKPISFTQYPPGSELGASGFDPRPYIDEERRLAAEAQAQGAQGAQGAPVKGGSRRRSRRSRKSKRSRKSRRTRR